MLGHRWVPPRHDGTIWALGHCEKFGVYHPESFVASLYYHSAFSTDTYDPDPCGVMERAARTEEEAMEIWPWVHEPYLSEVRLWTDSRLTRSVRGGVQHGVCNHPFPRAVGNQLRYSLAG